MAKYASGGFRSVSVGRALVKPGESFDRLTVIGQPFYLPRSKQCAVCECACGSITSVHVDSLLSGSSRSCGCLARETAASREYIHGGVGTRLYRIWSNMRQRCENPKCDSYRRYGAKGVRVCESWKSFSNFQEWAMANGYQEDLTIDRKENSIGYSPGNCRWTTREAQAWNKPSHGNRSGYKGVSPNGLRGWMAKIAANGVERYLGTYKTAEEAFAAYTKAAEEMHGEFANTNLVT